MAPRFRSEHIGSLIRPDALLSARAAIDSPFSSKSKAAVPVASTDTANSSDIATIQASSIRDVVRRQVDLGVTPITSGEFERLVFCGSFFEKLEGIEMRLTNLRRDTRPGLPSVKAHLIEPTEWPMEVAVAKVRRTKSAYMDDWLYLRSLLPRERWGEVKITLPTPEWFHLQRKAGTAYDAGVYDSDEELLRDLSKALRQELLALYDAGLRVAQIDSPNTTYFSDDEFLESLIAAGTDPDELFDLYVRTLNQVIEDLPNDFQVGIHLCRGNFPEAQFCATGGYDKIAARLLQELNFKVYYLEFDSDRAGDFQPLKALPKDKSVVLGLITTKYSELEDIGELKKRVYEAADAVAEGQNRSREEALRDNLAVSPQCGFASVNFGRGKGFDEAAQWKKLQLVKNLADEIWVQ